MPSPRTRFVRGCRHRAGVDPVKIIGHRRGRGGRGVTRARAPRNRRKSLTLFFPFSAFLAPVCCSYIIPVTARCEIFVDATEVVYPRAPELFCMSQLIRPGSNDLWIMGRHWRRYEISLSRARVYTNRANVHWSFRWISRSRLTSWVYRCIIM